ncbi:MAG: oligopeptidase B, partial [Bacteroidota bacterium]
MKNIKVQNLFLFAGVTLLSLTKCSTNNNTSDMPDAPIAKKVNKELSIHNHTRIDPYYWLNERENPEVIEYLEAENKYTEMVMKDTEQLQEKLYDEIVGRIKQDDSSVPYKDNGYYYYTRYETGKEYPIYCRKKETLEANEEILLNGNEMAEGHDYFQIGGLSISPDNKMMAYGVDTVSRRLYTIYFKNLETGEILEHTINNTTGGCSWANDNQTVFYTLKNP